VASDHDSVFCDGEQTGNFLLNRVVALFEVSKLEANLEGNRFNPDRVYVTGKERDADQLSHIIRKEVIPHLKRFRNAEETAQFEQLVHVGSHLDLCPVTRRIVMRYKQREIAASEERRCTVFVSYGGSDEYTARKVYDEIHHSAPTFFFPEYSHRDVLSRSIDDALDSATCLIVACTSLDNINRDRCAYEWKRFCRDWGASLKANNAVIVPFVASDINPEDLPRELREHFVVPFRPASFDKDLQELAKRIPPELRKSASRV
jgi:hypothetical protein